MSTNQEYEAALAVIADRDKSTLSGTKEILDALLEDLEHAVSSLDTLKEGLPAAGAAPTTARSNFDSTYNQVQGFFVQAGYIKANLEQLISQYPEI